MLQNNSRVYAREQSQKTWNNKSLDLINTFWGLGGDQDWSIQS